MSFLHQQIDSPLGRWTMTEWRPPHLAGLVEFLWHFEGRMTYLRERVFPNGLLEIILHLDARYRLVEGSGGPALCPTACVGGLHASPFVVEAPAHFCRVIGVRLRPVGAYAVLGDAVPEMRGLTVDLQDVAGRAALELVERCQAAETPEDRLRLTAAWVEERAVRSPGVDPAIAWIARQIERTDGAVSIAGLREQAGQSKTRLAAAFREQIGVPAKVYARILRFRRALARLDDGLPLADLAVEAGYYDQPHMNAEFRELSGCTPRELRAALRYAGSTSVAEAAS
jgi:AraC-like DNA-binding protein